MEKGGGADLKRQTIRILSACLCLCLLFFAACYIKEALPNAHPTDTDAPNLSLSEYILSCLLTGNEVIDLAAYHADEDAVRHAYSTLYATDPRLFLITSEYSISLLPDDTVVYLRPAYRVSEEPREALKNDFQTRVDAIVAPILSLSDTEKVAYLHDYMVTHFSYDDTHTVYDAYTLLTTGRGVCQAYALLFAALCRAAGVTCVAVPCFEMAHEWNAVKLNDEWYHIDLIWDDTDTPGEVLHTYFLIGDEELRARRALQDAAWDRTYTWDANFISPGIRTLSAPWRSLSTPFILSRSGTLTFVSNGISYRILPNLSCLSI